MGETRSLLKKGRNRNWTPSSGTVSLTGVPSSAEDRKILKYCEKTAGMIERNSVYKKKLKAFGIVVAKPQNILIQF